MKRLRTLLFSLCLLCSTQVFALSGGPDAYGYIWMDSYESGGPSYTWIDTNANWIPISGLADDNSVGPFNLYWDFHFYWGDYNSIKLGSNGWISFDNVSNIAHCFPSIPSPGGAGDNFVAPLMSDLNFSSSFPTFPNPGEVWYWTNLKDSAVVTFYNVPWWQNGTPDWFGSNTFQVLLDGTDSSITFTYQNMNPTFNDMGGCAQDVVLGIENSTGNVGLQCWADSLPGNSYAIRFFYPPTPLLSVKDLTPEYNQDTTNGGEFYPLGLIPALRSNIKNVGNDNIVTTSTITGTIQNLLFQNQYTQAHTIPSLLSGEDTLITFTPQANIATAGQYYWNVNANNANDINPGNNDNTSEINMIDLSGATAQLTYSTGGNPTGSLGWNGGQLDDGVGVYQKPPVYPVDITSLEYYISSSTNAGFIAAIYDDSGPGGSAGNLLFVDTIPAASVTSAAWNTVTLSSAVTINSGGYYVAWFMGDPNIFIGHEDVGPISRRSFEILSGQWADYRENNLRDFLIRVNIANFPCAITAGFSAQDSANVVDFTNLSTGATSYLWDFGDGNTSTATSPTHTYASVGTYTVCLISTNACGSDTTCSQVTVTCPAPSAGFTYSSLGITVQYTDASTAGITSWQWDFGDGNTSTQQNPSHTYAATGTYTVCLIVTNPCGSDTTCQTVVVCNLPTSSFLYSTSSLNANFTNTSSGATSWLWDFGDGNTSTQQNPNHTYAASGTYTVCLISTNSCDSDTSCQQVNVCQTPAPVWNYSQNGMTFNFTDNTPGSPTAWLWDFGDGNTSTQQNPQHTYAIQDTYLVCLIITDICGSDTTCTSVPAFPIGVGSGMAGFDLQLWPVPAGDRLQVMIEVPSVMDLELRLRDVAGKTLRLDRSTNVSGQRVIGLDVAELASGMYFLEVRAGDYSLTRKVIKE